MIPPDVYLLLAVLTISLIALLALILVRRRHQHTHRSAAPQTTSAPTALIKQGQAATQHFIKEVASVAATARQDITETLQQVESEAAKEVESEAKQAAAAAREHLTALLDRYDQQWTEEFNALTFLLKDRLETLDQHVTKTIKDELEAARTRVHQFEATEKKRVAQALKAAVPAALQTLIHRQLPLDLHETLIMDALQQAEQDQLFTSPTA